VAQDSANGTGGDVKGRVLRPVRRWGKAAWRRIGPHLPTSMARRIRAAGKQVSRRLA